MSKNLALPLILWNVLLTAGVAWLLLRPAPRAATQSATEEQIPLSYAERDTAALRVARIAYFEVDSLRKHSELIKEARKTFESEEKRIRDRAQSQARTIEEKAMVLMEKDQTYTTMAEKEADQRALMQLDGELRSVGGDLEDQIMRLNERILVKFSDQLQQVLKELNAVAGFDYIISMEPGGQVWPGNPGLNITQDVLDGMNRLHQENKANDRK